MEEYKLDKINSCVCTIQDNLSALISEILQGTLYPDYCLEKLKPMLNDTNCLISMFEEEKSANNK